MQKNMGFYVTWKIAQASSVLLMWEDWCHRPNCHVGISDVLHAVLGRIFDSSRRSSRTLDVRLNNLRSEQGLEEGAQ